MAGHKGEKTGNPIEQPDGSEREKGEQWRLRDVISELHVAHSGYDSRLGFGDRGASLTIEEQVCWVYRDFYEQTIVAMGTHTLGFSEIVGDESYHGLVNSQDHKGFLIAQEEELERARQEAASEFKREQYPRILFSIEADIGVNEDGQVQLVPPVEVLSDQEVGLDFVTAAFHYERIPKKYQCGEYFYQGFKAAIESGVVRRFGHPLWELHLVRDWEQEKYHELLALAKEEEISFEVNTARAHQLFESEPTSQVLRELIENGNLISFGTDFHNFTKWMKKSSAMPEGARERVTSAGQELMERWQWPIKFRQRESQLWDRTVNRVFKLDVSREMERDEANDYLWRLYKADESLPDFVGVDEGEKETVFSQLRDEFVEAVLPSGQGEEIEELRQRLSAEMTELFVMYQAKPERELNKEEGQFLEQEFAEVGMNLGDLKRALYCVYILRTRYNLPRSQFVNVWPVEDQLEHLRK